MSQCSVPWNDDAYAGRNTFMEVIVVPDPYELADLAEQVCLAESADGYVCCEEPNHSGWHRAEADGALLDTWPGVGQ